MVQVTPRALAVHPFLRGMAPDHLRALASAATEVMFPARHRIFEAGDYAGSFWLIESGYIALDMRVPGDGPAVIGTVGIGGLLGWSWLLPPYHWAFGAVCLSEVRAYGFNAAAVREMCDADPELRDELTTRVFQVLAGRLEDTRARLIAGLAE
jgi:CRP-like cAMP-binding protein